MSIAKDARVSKQQLGQFLTPINVARKVLDGIHINPSDKVLEPSFGIGSFVFAYMERLKTVGVNVEEWAQKNICGCEIDASAFSRFKAQWNYGTFPSSFIEGDFFRYEMPSYRASEYFMRVRGKFDLIIGNPPFGGTIDAAIQDELDNIYGFRNGYKIKKETYAFFIVKCLDLLKDGGRLIFICSDTMLSINTLAGLRRYLMETCKVEVKHLPGEFDDTNQPMVVLSLIKGGSGVSVFGEVKPIEQISRTANSSWTITSELVKYFTGRTLGDYFVASSGMTVGKNEYFLREIDDGSIVEPYDFEIYDRPITLNQEIGKARLGKISPKKKHKIMEQEARGETERALRVTLKARPQRIKLPHPDYAPYNKATNKLIYTPPSCVVYWKNDGQAVYTFKKSGPWYLHGVGGKPYFKQEGLSWQLISSHLNIRYLPAGYILDSGAPCAFLKKGVAKDEMYFVMGWCLTKWCNTILKKVINHTRNIQSKDFERLPYPSWVSAEHREQAIGLIKDMIRRAKQGESFSYKSKEISVFDELFAWNNSAASEERRHFRQLVFTF